VSNLPKVGYPLAVPLSGFRGDTFLKGVTSFKNLFQKPLSKTSFKNLFQKPLSKITSHSGYPTFQRLDTL
jgi:hypothetical protein